MNNKVVDNWRYSHKTGGFFRIGLFPLMPISNYFSGKCTYLLKIILLKARCHQKLFFCFRSSHQPSSECCSGSGWQVSLQISPSLSASSVPGSLARVSAGAAHLQRCSQPLSRGRGLGGDGGEWNCWNICHLPCCGCQQCWRSHWSGESSMMIFRG